MQCIFGLMLAGCHFNLLSSSKVAKLKYFAMDVCLCGNALIFAYFLKIAFSCGLLKSPLCDSGLARYRLMHV
jgi:hypothetical protein